ncbi:MAG: MarR family transcriptional regulator, partial [Zoogloea sp.]|nr:MarR family transcriptional regulator [Zoogloea sp.]
RAADRNEALPSESTTSFEDPADVVKLITTARLALLRAIKEMPGSITQIAERLRRDRSAVKRDVDELARAGLVTVSEKVLPGRGRMKEVRATAQRISLMAEVV